MPALAGPLLRVLRVLLIAWVVASAGLWLLGNWLMFRAGPPSYRQLPGLFHLASGDASIAALWLPNPAARYSILYTHGNAEDLGDDLPLLTELRAHGFSVLAWDYRGYGQSSGRPSERSSYRDLDTVYRHLTGTLGVPPERVIVLGHSLGGGPSAELASREPVAGLVLESSFTSAQSISAWGKLFPFDWFRTRRRLPKVRAPVLVIHGDADQVVPFSQGQALFRLAPGEKDSYWVHGAGHNDLVEVAGDRYWRVLEHFRDGLVSSHSGQTP
jgi:pimeloyl-ACP methyl ester carboxylesterase